MKRILLPVIFAFFLAIPLMAGKKQAGIDMDSWRYDLVSVGEGQQGAYKIKVWTYSKSPKLSEEFTRKCAVHGVLFKGIASNKGTSVKRPLIKDPQAKFEFEDFFQKFFADGGEYGRFVQLTSGVPEVIKVGKENKIGVVVLVQKDELRKYLEEAGIRKALDSGF